MTTEQNPGRGFIRKLDMGPKHLLLAGFRLATLALALIELASDEGVAHTHLVDLPHSTIAIIAIVYTGFKVSHPFRWYRSPFPGMALMAVDIVVCAWLLAQVRVIHASFALYTLNPVLASALLLPAKATVTAAGLTAAYYGINFFSFPRAISMENLSSMFFTYIAALGLTAWLPYIVNFNAEQRLRSRAISGERLKLGREIHDGLCQTIYGLRLELQNLTRDAAGRAERIAGDLEHLEELVGEAEGQARGSLDMLRSLKCNEALLPQIEKTLKHLRSQTGIDYRLELNGKEAQVDDLVKLQVLTICEEALRNVAKHSGAGEVTVRVHWPDGRLRVAIADDGRGMAADGKLSTGHGLTVMRERAESVGGSVQVISAPGRGTEVQVEVPRKWSL